MRFLACLPLLVVAVAGCAAPEDTSDPLIDVCPHWTARGAPLAATADVPPGGNVTQEWVPRDQASGEPRLRHAGHVFERIVVHVQEVTYGAGEGRLELYAHNATGRALLLYEHGVQERPDSLPSATFTSASPRTFDVYLAPVDEASTWEPSPIALTWTSATGANVTYEVTLYDRVCGIP